MAMIRAGTALCGHFYKERQLVQTRVDCPQTETFAPCTQEEYSRQNIHDNYSEDVLVTYKFRFFELSNSFTK